MTNNMVNLHKPELVVFDLDDTLYDYDKANEVASKCLKSAIQAYVQIESGKVDEALAIGRAKVKKRLGVTAASHSRLLYISEAFRQLGFRPDAELFVNLEDLYWSRFLEEMELFDGVIELLQNLIKNNIKIALLTDLTTSIQYKKITRLNLDRLFDIIITSEEAGGDKPTGLPFEMLAEIQPMNISSIWFLGDSEFDHQHYSHLKSVFFKKVKSNPKPRCESKIEFEGFSSVLDYVNSCVN